MSDYFKFFTKIKHTDRNAVDITRRAKILRGIQNDPFVYLPYTVENQDRPEHIAEYYYNDPNKVWLIYFANDIIDVYSQWVMNDQDFNNFFIKKYQGMSGTTGNAVISWALNTQTTDNVVYYQSLKHDNIQITPFSYLNDPNIDSNEWEPLRYYEYENILNDNKRNIYLIDRDYADQFEKELKGIVND